MDFGDGAASTVYVPEGTGSTTVRVSHMYYHNAGVFGGLHDGGSSETQWTVGAAIAPVTTDAEVVLAPSGQPATATVHQC